MKIILANGAELTALNVLGGRNIIDGISRDVLSFIFPETETMAKLDELFTETNCESITIMEDTAEGTDGHIHKGYTIRYELVMAPVEVTPSTAETPAVYENRITVKMAQRTYTESQIMNLSGNVYDDMVAAYQKGVQNA